MGEVDDVMGIAGEHVDGLDVIAINFPLQHAAFGVIEVTLLDEAVTLDHNELLKLGVVPVLALGYAGLGNVDAHLTGIKGVYQLGEAAAVIYVHPERECGLLVWQVAEVGTVEFLSKTADWNLRNHQCLGLGCEGLE